MQRYDCDGFFCRRYYYNRQQGGHTRLGSQCGKDGGVALGADSVASVDKDIAGYDPSTKLASTNTSAAWKATHAAVSVGNGSTATRQITGVAAGTNDTDAVNVAQLKAIAGGTGSIHFVSVKGGNASSVNYNNDGAKETGAIAIGANAEATANSAVAMGFNAQSNGSGSIVIGESSGLIPDASKRGLPKETAALSSVRKMLIKAARKTMPALMTV